MKKAIKILALAMALLLICCAFASCAKTLSGTYSASAGGTLASGKISLTFSGKNVTITTVAGVAGFTSTNEVKGTYAISEAADGTETITISVADKSEGEVKSILGTQSFSKGKDVDGNETISVGIFTFTKIK